MTVRELMKFLRTVDPKAEVVTFDHFGRPIALDLGNFELYDTPRGHPLRDKGAYLNVTTPDIGPEPE